MVLKNYMDIQSETFKQKIQAILNKDNSRSNFGKTWYTNGSINRFCYKCPEGFYKGIVSKKKRNVSEETRKKSSERIKLINKQNVGKTWYTDGTVNKICFECPEGFYKGKVQKRKYYATR